MRALIQRVSEASVRVGEERVASIGRGLLVLVGVMRGDGPEDADWLVRKVANLRIFEDAGGKMNLSVRDVGGEVLAVSQFTLAADLRRGNRPSFTAAEEPARAEAMFREFVEALGREGVRVCRGRFAAHMHVALTNDGPVTVLLDSAEKR
ncbi:MAG: D-aminoacyl-tRNA deacylase [Nitrospirota bacterium]|jgi:D-tyrosyl-tRNA(Tyr) deacylase